MKDKIQTRRKTKIFILVFFPVLLLLLPQTIFDNGHNTICIFKRATGKDCLGCGLTRACMHLIHLDFKGAAHYNKASFIVLPLLCALLVSEISTTYKKYRKTKLNDRASNADDEKPAV